MFTNGQKVVCIDDKFPEWVKQLYTALPKEGQVYVVRGSTVGVSYTPHGRQEGEIAIYLIGIKNPTSNQPPFRERGFNAERFRPLDELKEETKEQLVDCIGERLT
jgi:hypothetical protein